MICVSSRYIAKLSINFLSFSVTKRDRQNELQVCFGDYQNQMINKN